LSEVSWQEKPDLAALVASDEEARIVAKEYRA
jgi:hypothetical protein